VLSRQADCYGHFWEKNHGSRSVHENRHKTSAGLSGFKSPSIAYLVPFYILQSISQDKQIVGGSICEHWFQDDGVSRIHIFIDSATQGERQQIILQLS